MTSIQKAAEYAALLPKLEALLETRGPVLTGLSNLAALLYHTLPDVSWLGFYLAREGELLLGPFQGKPACLRIPAGRGVCGTAFAQKKTIVVRDVRAFEGHIACDSRSRSELVVPLFWRGEPVGVLDADSLSVGRFDETDGQYLEKACEILMNACAWEGFRVL